MVERNLAKVDVIGSNPIFRSTPISEVVYHAYLSSRYQGFESPMGGRPYTYSVLCVGSIDKLIEISFNRYFLWRESGWSREQS